MLMLRKKLESRVIHLCRIQITYDNILHDFPNIHYADIRIMHEISFLIVVARSQSVLIWRGLTICFGGLQISFSIYILAHCPVFGGTFLLSGFSNICLFVHFPLKLTKDLKCPVFLCSIKCNYATSC